MNRQQRRAGQAIHKKIVGKALKKGDWGEWVDITNEAWSKSRGQDRDRLIKFYKNNIYSAQVIKYNEFLLLGIRRHDESVNISWADKQRIKNDIIGSDITCVEAFPKIFDLVDAANMYWLWAVNQYFPLKEALEGVYS